MAMTAPGDTRAMAGLELAARKGNWRLMVAMAFNLVAWIAVIGLAVLVL